MRQEQRLTEEQSNLALQRFRFIERAVNTIAISEPILQVAEGNWPFPIATLDAIHLATADALRRSQKSLELKLLTHDKQLARNAAAIGYSVIGV